MPDLDARGWCMCIGVLMGEVSAAKVIDLEQPHYATHLSTRHKACLQKKGVPSDDTAAIKRRSGDYIKE
eukprot:4856740-Amphidinium_carterae.1